jgi:hypothetical protein
MNQRRRCGVGTLIRFAYTAMLVASLPCAALFGQSAAPVARVQTFHVHGMIRTYTGSIVPAVEVRFDGHNFSKTVFANGRGFYEAHLPVGQYAMTADALKLADFNFDLFSVTTPKNPYQTGLQEYQRPLFRVASPANLTLNVTLDPEGPSCEYVDAPSGATPTPTDDEIVCGGQDFFKTPSDDNVPFELLIRYRTRRSNEQGYAYNSRTDLPGIQTPVFVAYNLFTLQADHVVYGVQSQMLKATGNVAVLCSDGVIHRAESVTFKIENGQASPLP